MRKVVLLAMGLSSIIGLFADHSPDLGNVEALELAKKSVAAQSSYKLLLSYADTIKDTALRTLAKAVLENPAPTFMALYAHESDREKIYHALVDAGYIQPCSVANLFPPLNDPAEAPQPFWAAPGSGYASHHAYPGGLATHVAMNAASTMGYSESFKKIYGSQLNKDLILGAAILHDMMKPWVLQWAQDGSILPELKIAGTGAHHIFAITELLYRKLPIDLVLSAACTHENVGEEEAKIVGFIQAAALIAHADPIAYGVLIQDASGTLKLPPLKKPEYWVTGFGDYDWVFTSPITKTILPVLEDIYKEINPSESFNWFRNRVLAYYTTERLYNDYLSGGKDVLKKLVTALVK